MLVSKLPNGLIDTWDGTAYNIRKRQECEPNLSDLTEFVDQGTTLVNDLIFSREALECYSESSEKTNDERYSRVKLLAMETKIGDCPFCSARHDREECDELKKLPVNERKKVFFKKKLCCGCCQLIGDGHNSKTCTKRRKHRDCDGKHPTILHGLQLKKNDKGKLEKEIRKKEADKADSTGLMCVVLVKVQSKISNIAVRTWTLLGNCSQGSFVKKNLLEELKVEGKSTTVTVKTLNGD